MIINSNQIIVMTGDSSGFGNLTARAVAAGGHTCTPERGLRQVVTRPQYRSSLTFDRRRVDAHGIEMDVQDQASIDAAIAQIIAEQGRVDVLIHDLGHMVLGPAEASTPEQITERYDVNVVSTQRVNRTPLPHLRFRGSGLVLWVGSSSTKGSYPRFLAPYFAAKAWMNALAESYAAELIKFGVETSIIAPGAYASEVVTTVYDRIRHDFFHRIGIPELITPGASKQAPAWSQGSVRRFP